MVKIDANYHPQVLLLGNGLIQAYGGISWRDLLLEIAEPGVTKEYIEN